MVEGRRPTSIDRELSEQEHRKKCKQQFTSARALQYRKLHLQGIVKSQDRRLCMSMRYIFIRKLQNYAILT